MIEGSRVVLRPVRDDDWPLIEGWASSREALWGPYQRFQLDHVRQLREAYGRTGLLRRESGLLLIETRAAPRVVGFVRYTLLGFPDADVPQPEIGYGIPDAAARGQGFATEAVGSLVDYLFDGYPIQRVAALTDVDNGPSQRLLERLGFVREGVMRSATFRDGCWRDLAAYSLLRHERPARSVLDSRA